MKSNVLCNGSLVAKERSKKYSILTELWSKTQYLTAILKRSKIYRVLEMQVVVQILKLIFAKFEENPRCTCLDLRVFVIHIFLRSGRFWIITIFVLNNRIVLFHTKKLQELKTFFVSNFSLCGFLKNMETSVGCENLSFCFPEF
jgi:hypothetical protein